MTQQELKDLGLVGTGTARSHEDVFKSSGGPMINPLKHEQMDTMLKDMSKMQVLFAAYQVELTRVLKEIESSLDANIKFQSKTHRDLQSIIDLTLLVKSDQDLSSLEKKAGSNVDYEGLMN